MRDQTMKWLPLPVSVASSLAVARVKQEAPKSSLFRVVALQRAMVVELGNRMTGTNRQNHPPKGGPHHVSVTLCD